VDRSLAHLARLVALHEDVAGLLDLASLTGVPVGGSGIAGLVRNHVIIVGHLSAKN